MKRLLLFILAISSTQLIDAQSINLAKNNPNIFLERFEAKKITPSGEHPFIEKDIAGPVVVKTNKISSATPKGTIIGTTTYDLQSNSAEPGRLLLLDSGKIVASWTGSTQLTLSGWTDRGSFYNYFDGTSWGSFPTTRIETNRRTGWPSIVVTETGKEVLLSHEPTPPSIYEMVVMSRPTVSTGAWTALIADTIPGIWGRAIAGKGDTIHFINSNYCGPSTPNTKPDCDQFTQYWRSPDAGATWDIQSILPGLDTASGVRLMTGDIYAIDRQDTTLAIVSGGVNTPLWLWTSYDAGDTWTQKTIMTLIPNIDGFLEIDTPLVTNDGANEVLVDANGIIHVWTGITLVSDDDSTTLGYFFRPGANGLLYWNSTMATDSLRFVAGCLDIDNTNDLTGIGARLPRYGVGLASSPSVALDTATGTMYAVYVSLVENTDLIGDPTSSAAESYRDLFGIYSTDTGNTWSIPVNLTNSAKNSFENAFPSVAKIANGKVHVMWQRDQTAGYSLEENPPLAIENSDIIYQAFDYSDFDTISPIANFGWDILPNGTIKFSDSSLNSPTKWDWTFGNGFISGQASPAHTYANGTYYVCLTASNNYTDLVTGKSFNGQSTFCDSVTVTNVGIEDLSLASYIEVFPNPSNGLLTIDLNQIGAKTDFVEIYNKIGQKVYDESISGLKSKLILNLNGLENGNYFIKLRINNQFVTKQITLLK